MDLSIVLFHSRLALDYLLGIVMLLVVVMIFWFSSPLQLRGCHHLCSLLCLGGDDGVPKVI
jgi:hypothetical protein